MAFHYLLFTYVYLITSSLRVQAFFRINCNIIQTGRVDPVINPGAISTHAHTVAGSSGFGLSSTYDSLYSGSCTSCEVQRDKSAYWTPLLYYQFKNGSFTPVSHGGMVVYYLGRGDNTANFSPFPKGLQMLSGDNGVRAYDSATLTAAKGGRPVADRVSFACLDKSGPFPEKPYMWRTQCSDGLRAQIQFQTCWDGVNLYKGDQSHVAYLSQIDNGVCPPTHPVLLPHLFYEVLYGVADIKQDGGQFVFSNGDTTGYGYHGDFQNGWDPDIQKAAVDPKSGCLFTTDQKNGTFQGVVNDCPVLQQSDNGYAGWNCPERPPIVNEQVTGILSQLPGCNPVSSGPGRAPSPPANCSNSTLNNVPPQPAPIPSKPTPGQKLGTWTYAGCAAENSNSRALSSASTTDSKSMTVDACQSFCAGKKFALAGLEYGRECYCGNALNAPAKLLSTSDCDGKQYMNCAGNTTEICGAPSLLTVWNNSASPGSSSGGGSSSSSSVSPSSPSSSSKATTSASSSSSTTSTTVSNPTAIASNSALYLGCYSEPPSNSNPSRLLSATSNSSLSVKSNDACVAFCQSLNYPYAGTEYGGECYCGLTIGTASGSSGSGATVPKKADTECNMACAGDKKQLCGGPSRLSVWNNTLYVPRKNSSPVKVSSSSSSGVSYAYQGCFVEGANARTLGGNGAVSKVDARNMTVANCAGFCAASAGGAKYKWFGVEYASECYCSDHAPTTNKAGSDSDCGMDCSGSHKEFCGGAGRVGVWGVG